MFVEPEIACYQIFLLLQVYYTKVKMSVKLSVEESTVKDDVNVESVANTLGDLRVCDDFCPPKLAHALTYDDGILCSIVTNTVPRYKLSKRGIIIVNCLNCKHVVYSKPIRKYLECWYCGIKMKKPLRPSKECEAIVASDVETRCWNADADYRDDPLAGKYTNDDERYLAEDAWRDLPWHKTNCYGDFDDGVDDDDDDIDYIDG